MNPAAPFAEALDGQSASGARFIRSRRLLGAQRWVAATSLALPFAGFVAAVLLARGAGLLYVGIWGMAHMLGMIGVSLGYHRLGSHRSFRAPSVVKRTLYALASASAQGPLVYWVSNHRRHHELSDAAGDVHSPYVAEDGSTIAGLLRGLYEAQVGWMFRSSPSNPMRYSRDLLGDEDATFVNRTYYVWVALGLLVPGLVALAVVHTAHAFALGVLFGGLARVFTVQHASLAINSLTHAFGARPFESGDRSTNLFWLALPSAGESWHNNHHAFPSSARFGLRAWQIDLAWLALVALRALRLASDVKVPTEAALRKKATRRTDDHDER